MIDWFLENNDFIYSVFIYSPDMNAWCDLLSLNQKNERSFVDMENWQLTQKFHVNFELWNALFIYKFCFKKELKEGFSCQIEFY